MVEGGWMTRKSAFYFQGEDLQIWMNKYPSQKTSVGDRRGLGGLKALITSLAGAFRVAAGKMLPRPS